MNDEFDYKSILRRELEERISENSSYSLRAFARDLGLKAPNLSGILNGKKGLSETSALKICQRLGLNNEESSFFCHLVNAKHAKSRLKREIAISKIKMLVTPSKSKVINENKFKIISDWYHFAIMELIHTKDFKSDPTWIAQKLGLNTFQVKEALNRLQKLKLIKFENGQIFSSGIELETTNGTPSESIRKLNKQLIGKAKDSVTLQNIDQRHLSTLTTAIHKSDIKKYGDLIENFKRELNNIIVKNNKKNRPDEVYCLSVQFFQLTESKESL